MKPKEKAMEYLAQFYGFKGNPMKVKGFKKEREAIDIALKEQYKGIVAQSIKITERHNKELVNALKEQAKEIFEDIDFELNTLRRRYNKVPPKVEITLIDIEHKKQKWCKK